MSQEVDFISNQLYISCWPDLLRVKDEIKLSFTLTHTGSLMQAKTGHLWELHPHINNRAPPIGLRTVEQNCIHNCIWLWTI